MALAPPVNGDLAEQTGPKPRPRQWELFWQLLGIFAGPLLVYYRIIQISIPGAGEADAEFTTYRLVYGLLYYAVGVSGWLWLVYHFVSRCRLARLNLRPGTLARDIGTGVVLFIVLWILVDRFRYIQYILFPLPSSGVIENMDQSYINHWWHLVLMAGPYSFLAAGMTEEFTRVFLLERLRAVWNGPAALVVGVALSTFLFGYCHYYQGWDGMVSNGFFGLLMALYYYRFGRILPMIIAHGLFSSAATIIGTIGYMLGWYT